MDWYGWVIKESLCRYRSLAGDIGTDVHRWQIKREGVKIQVVDENCSGVEIISGQRIL